MRTFVPQSELGQDTFVYEQLIKPFDNHAGTFLDIGANNGVWISNTHALEVQGWQGLLVDIGPGNINYCRQYRTSPALCQDATTVDWGRVCDECILPFPERRQLGRKIDYLSLDVDDAPTEDKTFRILKTLLSSGFSFRAVTCEHDAYLNGAEHRRVLCELLQAHGYKLFNTDHLPVPESSMHGVTGPKKVNQQEDWWLR